MDTASRPSPFNPTSAVSVLMVGKGSSGLQFSRPRLTEQQA
jgi:hypothetical protein